jgi:hypothetical protein
MSQSQLKDGRVVDNSLIVDFDATHTNCVNALTPDEYALFVAAKLPDLPPAPPTILSEDLMALFTTDDATKIQAAINGNVQFWLLWSAMQAQSEPMIVTNPRFLQGWEALVTVLGADRMAAIATALSVTINA